jgi:hypothetical protein
MFVLFVLFLNFWEVVFVPIIAERQGYGAGRAAPAPAKPAETPKPAVAEPGPVAVVKDAPAKSAMPKPKDAPAASRVPEPSKAKPKPAEQKPAEPKPAAVDVGPGVAKTPQEFFGGEDDIEILEEDVKAS